MGRHPIGDFSPILWSVKPGEGHAESLLNCEWTEFIGVISGNFAWNNCIFIEAVGRTQTVIPIRNNNFAVLGIPNEQEW